MDYLKLETSVGGFADILVVTDHYTRYAVAIPTRNQEAKTTAEALMTHFIQHYGFPRRLHSDQGANFEGHVIKDLCKMAGVTKSKTTSYHPMGNGMTERFNRTLLGMLSTLETSQKRNWKKYVFPLVHAYNCTRHEGTRYSPYYLMYGREPQMPIDVAFGIGKQQGNDTFISYVKYLKDRLSYVKYLKDRLSYAYTLANKNTAKDKERQKTNYDKRIKGCQLHIGDTVLVRILAHEGKHKIADTWESNAYTVVDIPNVDDIPVYVVEDTVTGKRRTLHRNHLFPIHSQDVSDTDNDNDDHDDNQDIIIVVNTETPN